MPGRSFRVGITCYPSVGGSGILASALGEELARRGHDVHFISYDRPFRLPAEVPRIHFHPVEINDYELFKYPDYTLPLSVKMAEVARDHALDLLHVHYAVPHATAAILARAMSRSGQEPRVVTTLHGTDTTLLGRDAGYGPAISHALTRSDAVTAVSGWLRDETVRLLKVRRPIDVIPNFFTPRPPGRSRAEIRAELGVGEAPLVVHVSNLRPVKRIDLLLETIARTLPGRDFRLLVLAGGDFRPFVAQAERLGVANRVVVRENVFEVEDYVAAADVGLFTSDSESFCLEFLRRCSLACRAFRLGSVECRRSWKTAGPACSRQRGTGPGFPPPSPPCWMTRPAASRWVRRRVIAPAHVFPPRRSSRAMRNSTRASSPPRPPPPPKGSGR